MLALLMLFSCAGNIKQLYEQEKDAVLASPPAAGKSWEPELRLRLSESTLQALAEQAVSEGLVGYDETIEVKNPLGIKVTVQPQATVDTLTVAVGEDCGGCLKVDARLGGKAKWSAGGNSGKVPFTARVKGTFAFEVTEAKKGWKVSGRLVELDKVKLESDAVGALDVTSFLGDWTRAALGKAPDLNIGIIGGDDMPLRALRLDGGNGSIEIQALGTAVGGEAVPAATGRLKEGWDVRMHQDTALAMARRKAFELGTIDFDVAIDPRGLSMKGDAFTMDLRLWRLAGAGWWREYAVDGTVAVANKKIRMEPTEAREGEKSKGAGLADPIALLAEGRILAAVTDGMNQAFPGGTASRVGEQLITTKIAEIGGEGEVIRIQGSLEMTDKRTGRSTPVDAPAFKGRN